MSDAIKIISIMCLTFLCCFISSLDVGASNLKAKAGEWEGEPSVSFKIENGKLIDFKISVPLAMGSCDIKISEISIMKTEEIKFTKTGEIKSFATNTNEYFTITGKFMTPTSIEGKVNINICPDPDPKGNNNAIMLVPWEKKWKANHKQ